MKTEDQIIPFHSTDLTGRRVLVLAPHPDDETIGCGGTLALHAAASDPVQVVILTNGAKGDMFGRFDRDDYLAMRQQEARAASACLGISDVTFWPYEDRELANARTMVSEMAALINTYHPDLIYAPSPLEFHPDHRAVADFIQTAVKSCRFDADLLFYEVGQPLQADILVDITRVLDQKIQALKKYRSQLEERPYDDLALALNRFRSLTLPNDVTHAEGFIRYRSSGKKNILGNWTERSGEPGVASNPSAPGQAGVEAYRPASFLMNERSKTVNRQKPLALMQNRLNDHLHLQSGIYNQNGNIINEFMYLRKRYEKLKNELVMKEEHEFALKTQIQLMDKHLREANLKIVFLDQIIAQKDCFLQEIFASKGWRWLTWYRNMKQRVVVNPKRYRY